MEYISSVNNNNCEDNLLKPDLDIKSKGQCNYFKSSYARSLSFSKNRTKSLLSVNCDRANCESSSVPDELDNVNYKTVNVIDDKKNHQKKSEPLSEEVHHPNHRCATNKSSCFDSIVLQTQVNTLQWQLKQVESTRQMYQTVLEEVLRFLKKCYQHLNLLVEPWPRSKSEKHIINSDINDENISHMEPMRAQSTINLHNITTPSLLEREFHKFSRDGDNNNKTFNLNLDTEKLSNEAFRLYRTTENLINMRGPTLMPMSPNNNDPTEKTNEIISQPNKTYDTFLSESEIIGSLDLQEHKNKNVDLISLNSCTTGSIHSSSSKSSTDEDTRKTFKTYSPTSNVVTSKQFNPTRNKSNHMISSNCIDVESGFSSMNSFQEIGLPVVNSTQIIMPQNFNSFTSSNGESGEHDQLVNSEVQSDCTIQRKWNSLPMSTKKAPAPLFEFKCDETLKVLWV